MWIKIDFAANGFIVEKSERPFSRAADMVFISKRAALEYVGESMPDIEPDNETKVEGDE